MSLTNEVKTESLRCSADLSIRQAGKDGEAITATLVGAISFTLLIGSGVWVLVFELVIGGLFVTPFAPLMTKDLSARALLILVDTLIGAISALSLYKTLFS